MKLCIESAICLSMTHHQHLIHQALVGTVVVELHVVPQLVLLNDLFELQGKGIGVGVALEGWSRLSTFC